MKLNLFQAIRALVLPPRPITAEYLQTDYNSSDSGQSVNKSLCLGVPAIRRAVTLIANDVAKLPINAIKYAPDGSKSRDYDNSGYKLLNENCSPYQSPFIIRRELVIDSIFSNGMAYILRNEFSEPYQLLLLDPDVTSIETIRGEPYYKTTLSNTTYRIPAIDIFHLRGLGRDLLADPLTQIARNALGLSLSLQTYAGKYFRQGQGGAMVVELPPALADLDKRKQFVNDWKRTYEGNTNAHKTLFVPPQVKVTNLPVDNEKSQLLQSRTFDILATSQLFGIEPFMLGANIQTSYSSLMEANQNYLDHCLDPYLCQMEAEANLKLRTYSQQRLGRVYFEFERKALISMDSQGETDLVTSQLDASLISEEYGRRILNLPAKAEGETYRGGKSPTPETPQTPPASMPMNTPPDAPMSDPGASDTARQFVAIELERLTNRLVKASKGAGFKLSDHRDIAVANLAPIPRATEMIDEVFSRIEPELEAVLPEQRETIIRFAVNKLERLLAIC